MNNSQIKEFYKPNRHILALAAGIIGGSLPNQISNINHLLMGGLLAGFLVKVIYGDYDLGYQWTFSDIIFWFVVVIEGVIASYIFNLL